MRSISNILPIGHTLTDTPRRKTLKSVFATIVIALSFYSVLIALLADRSQLERLIGLWAIANAMLSLTTLQVSKSLNLAFAVAVALGSATLAAFYFLHGNRDGDFYFFLLIPTAAVVLLGPKGSRVYFALTIGLAIAILIIDPMLPKLKHEWHLSPLNPQGWLFHGQDKYLMRNIEAVAFFTVSATAYFLLYSASSALEDANQRVESLLLNVLPRSVAERLIDADERGNPTSIVESFDEATILFADIVGFTKLSHDMPPGELIRFLNDLFSAFDELAEKHGVEKIKTIGDAYMAVSGLPELDERHAARIADMALDILATTQRFSRETGRALEIRIGINSGPVIAGVIGRRKFIYDLWGDAVNMASRMERHSAPSVIQTGDRTYEILKDEFSFASIGNVDVRGLGKLDTWQLLARR